MIEVRREASAEFDTIWVGYLDGVPVRRWWRWPPDTDYIEYESYDTPGVIHRYYLVVCY